MGGVGRSNYGSRAIAALRVLQARRAHGNVHPATQAALGRWLALSGKGLPDWGCVMTPPAEALERAYTRQIGRPWIDNRRQRSWTDAA